MQVVLHDKHIVRSNKIGAKKYTIKLHSRKIDCKDPLSYVNLCLLNDIDNKAIWHRYHPKLDTITEDVVEFNGNDIGNISSLLISPESCKYNLDAIEVITKDQNQVYHIDSSIPDNNVYFTKTDPYTVDEEKREINNREYEDLKQDILITSTQLIASISLLYGLTGNMDESLIYGIGGITSIIHHKMIQDSVDNIDKINLNNMITRLAILSAGIYAILGSNVHNYEIDAQQFLAFVLGLLSCRIAISLVLLKKYFESRKID
jgi:hypothetical protein